MGTEADNIKTLEQEEMEAYLQLGELLFEILLGHEDTQFIICPCSIGDTVNIAAFLSSYKRVHSHKKCTLVVKEAQEDFISMFPEADGVLAIDNLKMFALRIYVAFYEKYRYKNVLYGHFVPEDLSFASYKTTQELSFVNEYKASVLEIPLNSEMDEVVLPKTEVTGEDRILILPYAKSFKVIDNSFWEALVEEYVKRGKTVFCNIAPGEQCIKNALPCQVSIRELCGLAFSFEQIIGLRSGAMDALSLTGCTLDVIYTGVLKTVHDSCKLDGVRLWTDISELNKRAVVRNYAYVEGREWLLMEELLNQITVDIL